MILLKLFNIYFSSKKLEENTDRLVCLLLQTTFFYHNFHIKMYDLVQNYTSRLGQIQSKLLRKKILPIFIFFSFMI